MSDAPLSFLHTESAELISRSGISFQLILEFWFFSVFPAAHSRELSFALYRKPHNSSSSEDVPMRARNDAHEVTRNAGQIWSGLTLRERRPFGLCASPVSSLGPPGPAPDSSGSSARVAAHTHGIPRGQATDAFGSCKRGKPEFAWIGGRHQKKFCSLLAKWSRFANWTGLTA